MPDYLRFIAVFSPESSLVDQCQAEPFDWSNPMIGIPMGSATNLGKSSIRG
jgi:hypothetical protein